MDIEQLEHALKVMYAEIKSLKKQVKDLECALEYFAETDVDASTKKRHYWNIDNHVNR